MNMEAEIQDLLEKRIQRSLARIWSRKDSSPVLTNDCFPQYTAVQDFKQD